MKNNLLNENHVLQTLNVLHPDTPFEIRIKKGKFISSGYFEDHDTAFTALNGQDLNGAQVYITLNSLHNACLSREQKNVFKQYMTTTSDNDIIGRDWILIDLDPTRPADTSATDDEIRAAKRKATDIYNYLKTHGFSDPVWAFSGNGIHLLYRIKLANNAENKKLISDFLKTLDALFSDETVKVDISNFNAARICKLYGTVAQKGSHTPERPHRMSQIMNAPEEIHINEKKFIASVIAELDAQPEKSQYNGYKPKNWSLEEWLNENCDIPYTTETHKDYTKYVLEHCPFDETHRNKDAVLFQFSNGGICFKCLHDSCQGHTWQEMRMMYQPNAYEKIEQERTEREYKTYNRDITPKQQPTGDEFISPIEFISKPQEEQFFIKTGITAYDQQFKGLKKKTVTVLSGYTGGAKSTLLSQMILEAVQNGNRVACFSGELSDDDFYDWMFKQAAGVDVVTLNGFSFVNQTDKEKIAEWLQNKFWLYKNDFGYDYDFILRTMQQAILDKKLDLICIDNLMALDLSSLSGQELEAQKKFAWSLHEMAMKYNIAVVAVCHPRKPSGILQTYDVLGSSNIVNAFDTVVFAYRCDQLFHRYYKEFYGTNYEPAEATNVIHVSKCRFGRVNEDYIPLYYNPHSYRLKNYETECKVYGWKNDLPVTKTKSKEDEEFDAFFQAIEEETMELLKNK